MIALLRRKSVDVVMRVHQARKVTGRTIILAKPRCRTETWEPALWDELPGEIKVRIVSFRIEIRGFRTQHIVLLTTLLDEARYSDEQIAALYYRRWAAELFFRDIKTTLGLDILRCQSSELIEKEVLLEVIAYNLIRALMLEAAWTYDVPVQRLSFKGTVDTLRQWTPLFFLRTPLARHARAEFIRIIASDTVPLRPNRSEPRARRPKSYQLLTRPRHKMVVSPSRSMK